MIHNREVKFYILKESPNHKDFLQKLQIINVDVNDLVAVQWCPMVLQMHRQHRHSVEDIWIALGSWQSLKPPFTFTFLPLALSEVQHREGAVTVGSPLSALLMLVTSISSGNVLIRVLSFADLGGQSGVQSGARCKIAGTRLMILLGFLGWYWVWLGLLL